METSLPELPETTDSEHLKLLSLFHYILSGMAAFLACFPIIHLVVGLFFIFAPHKMDTANRPPPAFLGWFFVIFASFFILAGWTFAVLVLLTGRFIAQRKKYTFCFVMAAVECVFMPFGTVLGVFTILVLNRPRVRTLFTPKPVISGITI